MSKPFSSRLHGFVKNYVDSDSFFYYDFNTRYVISGNSTHDEFAYVIEDATKARQFFNSNPIDSIINTDQSSTTANNWKGDIALEKGYLYDFYEAINKFKKEGYPDKMLNTYANVYMISSSGLNMGIKLQQKIDGKFKELTFEEKTDLTTGEKHYRIKICN